METFHMVVLGVATVILIGMLVSIGFMLKKGSRAVTYPPVPSACPDKWIAGTDANGTTCAINDASFNMSQIVAVGAKSMYSVNGTTWNETAGKSDVNGLVNVSGNNWLYTKRDGAYKCTIATNGTITNDIKIDGKYVSIVNGIMSVDSTMFYIYGSEPVAADETTPATTIGAIQLVTFATTTYTLGSIVKLTGSGLMTVKGLANNGTLFVAVGDGEGTQPNTVSSATRSAEGFSQAWTPRGNVSTSGSAEKYILTPTSISFGGGRFVVVGVCGNAEDPTPTKTRSWEMKPVGKSTIATAPGSISGINKLQWTGRSADDFTKCGSGIIAASIVYASNKFIAICNKAFIATSTDGANWVVKTQANWTGGNAIGHRGFTTPADGANIGKGNLRSVNNVTWDDAYNIRLGTSTICEQRYWAAANNITWDGVSDYNGCS